MASSTHASADDFEEENGSTTAVSKQRPADHVGKRNAFTELMASKTKPQPESPKRDHQSKKTTQFGRDGLAAYTKNPGDYPQSRVVYYNDKFVVINDLYPKASVHLLILPRDPKINCLRPQEAFDDPVFLTECREQVLKVRDIVASELRRKFGPYSAIEKERNDAMDLEEPPSNLPTGRDWSSEILVGTHANPSMNHLHIHVLSRDMRSESLKKKNHYLSFVTDFFIPMEDYPLANIDFRRDYKHFSQPDMRCWRCGLSFGNKMTALKEHLEMEFDEWRKE